MRNAPDDKYDRDELRRMKAEPWMVELLSLNPDYCSWGPHEDYMWTRGDKESGEGWNGEQFFATWRDFGWKLDDLNECVNFYFSIERDSEECKACGGSGHNPATREIADTFYDHGDYSIDFVAWKIRGNAEAARRPGGATGRRWCDAITEDELQALRDAGRIRGGITLAEVNAANAPGARGGFAHTAGVVNHDGINRSILIETRAKRLGVDGECTACDGHGHVYTSPSARVALTLWWLHPRKGASRGIEIKSIARADLPAVAAFLRDAADRNAARFSKIVALAPRRDG